MDVGFRKILFAIVILAASWALVFYGQTLGQNEAYPLRRIYLGFDFRSYYESARCLLVSGCPVYPLAEGKLLTISTPPLSTLVAAPFLFLPWERAAPLFSLATLLGLATVLLALFRSTGEGCSLKKTGLTMIFGLLGYPLIFLIDRGNIDGMVFTVFGLGLVCLFHGRDLAAGTLLSFAANLKLYPALALVALVAQRRWRAVVAATIAGSLGVAVFWEQNLAYLQSFLARRAGAGIPHENLTLFPILNYPTWYWGWSSWEPVAKILFFSLVGLQMIIALAVDAWRLGKAKGISSQEIAVRVALYIPYFCSLPQQAYAYSGTGFLLLIPVGCLLARHASLPHQRILVGALFLSMAATFFPAAYCERAWQAGANGYYVNMLGVALACLASLGLRVTLCRALTSPAAPSAGASPCPAAASPS